MSCRFHELGKCYNSKCTAQSNWPTYVISFRLVLDCNSCLTWKNYASQCSPHGECGWIYITFPFFVRSEFPGNAEASSLKNVFWSWAPQVALETFLSQRKQTTDDFSVRKNYLSSSSEWGSFLVPTDDTACHTKLILHGSVETRGRILPQKWFNPQKNGHYFLYCIFQVV